MATNNNGNLLDSSGEVAIDFVWGNFPMQPNDARPNTTAERLDPALDNHIIALSGWNGYPQYTPNTPGEDVAGATDYVLVPSVIGLTTTLAADAMKDASLVVTTASAATNAGHTVTAASRTSGSNIVTVTAASHSQPVGGKITISDTGDATVNGTWTVLTASTNQFTFAGTATTALSLTSLAGVVAGVEGTIKAQSLSAGQNSVVPGSAVTITPWAAQS